MTKWKLATTIPESVGKMIVLECDPSVKEFAECEVVFSGLDEKVGEIGEWAAVGWSGLWDGEVRGVVVRHHIYRDAIVRRLVYWMWYPPFG